MIRGYIANPLDAEEHRAPTPLWRPQWMPEQPVTLYVGGAPHAAFYFAWAPSMEKAFEAIVDVLPENAFEDLADHDFSSDDLISTEHGYLDPQWTIWPASPAEAELVELLSRHGEGIVDATGLPVNYACIDPEQTDHWPPEFAVVPQLVSPLIRTHILLTPLSPRAYFQQWDRVADGLTFAVPVWVADFAAPTDDLDLDWYVWLIEQHARFAGLVIEQMTATVNPREMPNVDLLVDDPETGRPAIREFPLAATIQVVTRRWRDWAESHNWAELRVVVRVFATRPPDT